MKILALDCSVGPASVAVIENGNILASSFINVKLTHSQTLLSMVENTLDFAKISLSDIDAFAINNGPGSFTGIRIGISAVKGLAAPTGKPCIEVSTLLCIANLFKNQNCTVCAVMDARCNQVYNAIFKVENGKVTRLCEDRAVMINEVIAELDNITDNIIIAGDGAELFREYTKAKDNVIVANEPSKFQNAVGTAMVAEEKADSGQTVLANELSPFYLRLPQAERELKAKSLKGE